MGVTAIWVRRLQEQAVQVRQDRNPRAIMAIG